MRSLDSYKSMSSSAGVCQALEKDILSYQDLVYSPTWNFSYKRVKKHSFQATA